MDTSLEACNISSIIFEHDYDKFLQIEKKKHEHISSLNLANLEAKTTCVENFLSTKDSTQIEPLTKLEHSLHGGVDQKTAQLLNLRDDMVLKIKAFKDKYNGTTKENQKLSEKIICLKKEIEELNKERRILRSDYKTTLIAYKHAYKYYTTTYNFQIDVEDIQGDLYTSIVRFKVDDHLYDFPIKFVIDSKNKNIISFDASSICTNEESLELEDWYSKNKHPSALICKLRHMFLMKIKSKNL